MPMSVKSKLILALSLILVSTFLATSLINYAVTKNDVREDLLNSALPLTGKNIYSEIQGAMLRPILVSSSMANDTFLKDWVLDGEQNLDEIKQYLDGLQSKYGFLTTFFVSAVSDNYYYQDGILKKIGARDPHDVWFYSFTRTGKEYDLDVDSNEAEGGALTIFVNFRVEDDNGRLLGVAGVGVNIDHAATLLKETEKEYNREIYLVDQDGLIQVHRDKSLIEKVSILKADGINRVADAILNEQDKAAAHQYDWNGQHFLLSTRYIPELAWFLIVEQNEDQALETARKNLIRTLVIGGGGTILVILLCILTVNYFQGRLEAMAQTDPLTGAAYRRALENSFAQAVYKANRYGTPFATIIIDLDSFKKINDTLGHIQGDAVLKRVADIIQATIRPTDLLARWGGDEFIILLDGNRNDAKSLAERALSAVTQSSEKPKVSFCYGLSEYREGDELESMTMRADKDLYQAKMQCKMTDTL